MEAVSKELIAPESHQHTDPLSDLSEIQSDCELPVKEPHLTPTQVRAIVLVSLMCAYAHNYVCTHMSYMHFEVDKR